jgi:uncharacterized RDD family membrane protein YckC
MTDEANPYRPPSSKLEIDEAVEPRPIELASKGRRLGTFLVDYACFIVCAFCLGLAVALALGDEGITALQQIPDIVLGSVMIFTYYVFFEGIWARTPGKLLFGTIVVNEAGGKPSIGQVFGRTLSRFIPFEPLSFLGTRGWHDSLSRTYVVRARSR